MSKDFWKGLNLGLGVGLAVMFLICLILGILDLHNLL